MNPLSFSPDIGLITRRDILGRFRDGAMAAVVSATIGCRRDVEAAYHPPPKSEILKPKMAFEQAERAKSEIKDLVFQINYAAHKHRGKLNRPLVRQELEKAKIQLADLREQFPQDEEVKIIGVLFDDLYEDFMRGREIDLDTSMMKLFREYKEKVNYVPPEDRGILPITPEEQKEWDRIGFADLKKLGIECGGGVMNRKKDPNAPTVFLIKFVHPSIAQSPGMREAANVEASEGLARDVIMKLLNAGVIKTLFTEGDPVEVTEDAIAQGNAILKEKGIPTERNPFWYKMKLDLGSKIRLPGPEETFLLLDMAERLDQMNPDFERDMLRTKPEELPFVKNAVVMQQHRATTHNLFVAIKAMEDLKRTGEKKAAMIFGVAHEQILPSLTDQIFQGDFGPVDGNRNPLALSRALSYFGANVVIIDAARVFDRQKFLDYMNRKIEETR